MLCLEEIEIGKSAGRESYLYARKAVSHGGDICKSAQIKCCALGSTHKYCRSTTEAWHIRAAPITCSPSSRLRHYLCDPSQTSFSRRKD